MSARPRTTPGARVALLLLALAVAPAAQMAPRNHPLQRRHLMTVRAERTGRFLELWSAADEAHRAAARRYLDETGRDAPLGRRPALADLSFATRLLAGADPDELAADALARVARSLDLQVVPGAFPPVDAAAPDARGEPLTVGCYLLERRALATLPVEELELTLTWLGPGGERLHGRTERVATSPFFQKGVVLYLRAPRSAPGRWRLQPEVRLGERRAVGFPVPVACVPGGALDPELHEHGLRTLGPPSDPAGRAPVPLADLPPRLHGVGTSAGADARLHLILCAPEGEPAAGLFAAPLGAAWSRLAEAESATLWSLELAAADHAAFVDLLARARRASPAARLVVVGRGDAAFTLQRLWRADSPTVDGLVLVAPLVGVGPPLPAVPTLVLGAGEGEREPADVSRRPGSGASLVDELSLPAELQAWLGRAFP